MSKPQGAMHGTPAICMRDHESLERTFVWKMNFVTDDAVPRIFAPSEFGDPSISGEFDT